MAKNDYIEIMEKNHMEIPWHDYTENDSEVLIQQAGLIEKASVVGRVGLIMLSCGTGAWRVRTSMNRLSKELGVTCTVDVGLMSIEFNCFDGKECVSQSLSIANTGVNTSKLYRMEQFVNSFPSQEAHLTGEEIHKRLDEIEQIHELYSPVKLGLAAALACCGFTFLLGGGPVEMIFAFIAAGVGNLIRMKLIKHHYADIDMDEIEPCVPNGLRLEARSIMKFYNIFFSPTGGTKKVADIIINGTKQEAEVIDLIKEPDKIKKAQFKKDDVCLVGVPSYGGRIPSVITEMFRNVKADGTKAILAVVFGNRAIDDTLLELQDVLEASGFVCIAGMEAVAEHSLLHQFGTGRPDSQDEKELMGFAAKIMENIATQRTPEFPGNRPYRQYGGVPFKPTVNKKCTSCGLCAKECPTGAISLDDPKITDNDKCISCMHCVAVCPKKARNYSKFISFIAGRNMKKICSGRKENKLYL